MVKQLRKIIWYGLLMLMGCYVIPVNLQAQGSYNFLISALGGLQHTGYSSNDTYINKVKEAHGSLTSTRVVNPLIVSIELYQLRSSFGVGFGLENERYTTDYEFSDGSSINVSAGGIFHNILFKYQGGFWEPYFGVGTGTYTAILSEQLQSESNGGDSTRAVMRISNTQSNQGKIGVRIPILNICGIMFSFYSISAPIMVPTEGEKLELGGDSGVTGIYCQF